MSQQTTQHATVAIFKQVEQYNRLHDTSKPLFFDTETTGGGPDDQIIETLIYTNRPSSLGAFKVHGVNPHELLAKPTFIDIQPAIVQLLKGRTLYAYNVSFDIRMLRQSGHKLRLQQVTVKCLCKQFANFIGQYSPYFKSNRYFSLSSAYLHFNVEHTNAHRAAADALACVTVWEGILTSYHLRLLISTASVKMQYKIFKTGQSKTLSKKVKTTSTARKKSVLGKG